MWHGANGVLSVKNFDLTHVLFVGLETAITGYKLQTTLEASHIKTNLSVARQFIIEIVAITLERVLSLNIISPTFTVPQ